MYVCTIPYIHAALIHTHNSPSPVSCTFELFFSFYITYPAESSGLGAGRRPSMLYVVKLSKKPNLKSIINQEVGMYECIQYVSEQYHVTAWSLCNQ
jgi:hypothetical protein